MAQPAENMERFSFFIPKELRATLQEMAMGANMSQGELVRRSLQIALSREGDPSGDGDPWPMGLGSAGDEALLEAIFDAMISSTRETRAKVESAIQELRAINQSIDERIAQARAGESE
jgi:hypothetical protein